ncbi:fizzy-related protein homolog [Drosophila bipectinata]|uniref:fizzy-related protein homolog n=1 Tax=Drosophila bipectinata TaxID=42026 RepID=UPI001C8A1B96|nr:fizzy-related protein homolog [Drosophila bipectinata]
MFQTEYQKRLLLRYTDNIAGREEFDLRCIPMRAGNQWDRNYFLSEELKAAEPEVTDESNNSSELPNSTPYACMLRNEFLDTEVTSLDQCRKSKKVRSDNGDFKERESTRLYKFMEKNSPTLPALRSPFQNVSGASQRLLSISKRPIRKLSRLPYKILDAPELQDDFYLNLIDWSSENMLAVGLGYSVYLWNGQNGHVTRLCDFSNEDNLVTAVRWHGGGRQVAIGTLGGYVTIWDAQRQKEYTKLEGHGARVTALAWCGNALSSGSRDRTILHRDVRLPSSDIVRRLCGHKHEVCGLQWSPTWQYLASGGNDKRLLIWTAHGAEPLYTFSEHKAVVKALAWSPHKTGLLASGGGSADRCLRFWNVLTGQLVQRIDTGAQISNLAWARNSAELVTTHGYAQPQVIVWRYPSLKKIVKLSGHTHRVVYLAVSPDNETIVTGGADETLRFWSVFTKRQAPKMPTSVLSLNRNIR